MPTHLQALQFFRSEIISSLWDTQTDPGATHRQTLDDLRHILRDIDQEIDILTTQTTPTPTPTTTAAPGAPAAPASPGPFNADYLWTDNRAEARASASAPEGAGGTEMELLRDLLMHESIVLSPTEPGPTSTHTPRPRSKRRRLFPGGACNQEASASASASMRSFA